MSYSIVGRALFVVFTGIMVALFKLLFMAWLGGSVLTSGVKAFAGDCGKRYPVEAVFRGNWFCAE